MTKEPSETARRVTLAGVREGARLVAPVLPGICVFAAAFGAAAQQKGMTVAEAALSSALVFAGASQLVGLELWTDTWTFAALLAIAVVTFTVNARMILQGASLQPWLREVPGAAKWPTLFLLTDANWVITERYRDRGGDDFGVLLGSGLVLWVAWLAFTLPGALLGGLMDDPKRFGVDLVLPIFFSAMIVPLWKGRRDTIAWSVAGLVSVATWYAVPGYAFMVAGPLAGALAGAAIGMAARR
ncbi:AzlC family ABC transporter permease [Alsobacter sp. SYSU M60028]|uniref:AzlC family ABC transporter permease n=1 Tax=Alsobacter ponti TaxID=2962936 RepID=A0ABT1LH28_9HYPH|nr:AzlC family ABC transporter permease [Alsobacter ponti]MCP8940807.1 AzlC family ABC transporter permease [Alsobacter ponti]